MKKKLFLIVLLSFCASALSAQTSGTDNSKTLEYLQGDGVYEQGVMVFLKGLKDSIWTHFDLFITDA